MTCHFFVLCWLDARAEAGDDTGIYHWTALTRLYNLHPRPVLHSSIYLTSPLCPCSTTTRVALSICLFQPVRLTSDQTVKSPPTVTFIFQLPELCYEIKGNLSILCLSFSPSILHVYTNITHSLTLCLPVYFTAAVLLGRCVFHSTLSLAHTLSPSLSSLLFIRLTNNACNFKVNSKAIICITLLNFESFLMKYFTFLATVSRSVSNI